MIGTFQKTLLEYVGSGKEIKYIANLLKFKYLPTLRLNIFSNAKFTT